MREIGRGTSSVVYEVIEPPPMERRLAAKVLRADQDFGAAGARRFELEQRALASLEHPSIVAPVGSGVLDDGRPYFVMRLVEGASITRWAADNMVPLEARLRLFVELCDAVHHAHRAGVHHRDLKPGHAIVEARDGRDQIAVIDFGIAAFRDAPPHLAGLTSRGEVLGSIAYMAPERFGHGPVDQRADVFALGAILIALVCGRDLEDGGGSALAIAGARARGEVPSLTSLMPGVNGDLASIAAKATSPLPDDRYDTAAALGEDVGRFLDRLPVHARRASVARRVGMWCRRQPWAAARLGALLVLVTAASAALLGWQQRSAADRAAARETATFLSTDLIPRLEATLGATPVLLDAIEVAHGQLDSLEARYPNDPALLRARADLLLAQGGVELSRRDPSVAGQTFRRAEAILRAANARPGHVAQRRLAFAIVRHGDACRALGRTSDALTRYLEAHDLLTDAVRRAPTSRDALDDLVWSLERLAHAYKQAGQPATAEAYRQEQGRRSSELLQLDPSDPRGIHARLAWVLEAGESALDMSSPGGAAELATEAVDLAERLVQADPSQLWYQRRLVRANVLMARSSLRAGDYGRAGVAAATAREVASRNLARDPSHADLRIDYAASMGLDIQALLY
ncbi:MAG: serine/threonine-protein kinase [Phycisphaerales bacterium]